MSTGIGAPPRPPAGAATSKLRMILGGRFPYEELRGEDMGGETFDGVGITGYDTTQRRYVSAWADSMSTALAFSAGHCTADRSSCTYVSGAWDPAQKTIRMTKMVKRATGPDTRVVTFSRTSTDGSEHPTMELTYTRRPAESPQ